MRKEAEDAEDETKMTIATTIEEVAVRFLNYRSEQFNQKEKEILLLISKKGLFSLPKSSFEDLLVSRNAYIETLRETFKKEFAEKKDKEMIGVYSSQFRKS